MKISEKSILLILLYLNNKEPIKGKTKFQKIVFLYEEEQHKQLQLHKKLSLDNGNLFTFRAHYYGPFSDKLVKSIETLISLNFVEKQIEENKFIFDDKLGEQITYQLSPIGIDYTEQHLLNYLDQYVLEKLTSFKNIYNHMQTRELIRYVYVTYEYMTENSRIKDEILNEA